MKQTIRYGTFETNSSSMHSLVIVKKVKPYTEEDLRFEYDPNYHETFELWRYCDERYMTYERDPFQVLRTPLDKLRYYCAYTLGNYKAEPNQEDIDRITQFIMEQTGITDPEKVILYKHDRWDNSKRKTKDYGVVCLNDTGEDPQAFIKRKNIDWKDLILNPKYTIIIDGDETQDFQHLIDAGIISTDTFEDISSGVDFWNNANRTTYISWFDRFSNKEIIDAGDIDSFTKRVIFKMCKLDKKTYKKHLKQIKDIIEEIHKHFPSIKCILTNRDYLDFPEGLTLKDFSKLDTSMFDEVVEHFEEY